MAVYQSYTTGCDTNYSIFNEGADLRRRGQTFTTADAYQTTSVKIYVRKVNSPAGNLTVAITATSGGLPTGSWLASKVMLAADLPTSYDWVEFIFTTPYNLSASTVYAIVTDGDDFDGSNYVDWCGDSSSPTYADGNHVYSTDDGVSWTALTTADQLFQTIGPAIGANPLMPLMGVGN